MNDKDLKCDEDAIPGSLNLAYNHASSCEFGDSDLTSGICISSNRYIKRMKLPFYCDVQEFEFLGPGIPLFFRFIQNCFKILLATFILQSI